MVSSHHPLFLHLLDTIYPSTSFQVTSSPPQLVTELSLTAQSAAHSGFFLPKSFSLLIPGGLYLLALSFNLLCISLPLNCKLLKVRDYEECRHACPVIPPITAFILRKLSQALNDWWVTTTMSTVITTPKVSFLPTEPERAVIVCPSLTYHCPPAS